MTAQDFQQQPQGGGAPAYYTARRSSPAVGVMGPVGYDMYQPRTGPYGAPQAYSPAMYPAAPFDSPPQQYGPRFDYPAQYPMPGTYPVPIAMPMGPMPPQTYLHPHSQTVRPTPASKGYGPPERIDWDPTRDAQACHVALRGFWTDATSLIRTLASKDAAQMEAMRNAYQRMHGNNLVKAIKLRTSGSLQNGLMQLAQGPLLTDVALLHDVLVSPGHTAYTQSVLQDILLARSNADMIAIRNCYMTTHRRDLEVDVAGFFKRGTRAQQLFAVVLQASRAEESVPHDGQGVQVDAFELHDGLTGRSPAHEAKACRILSTRSNAQIRAICQSLHNQFAVKAEDLIRDKIFDPVRQALIYQVRQAENKTKHAVVLIDEAIGATDVRRLRLLTSRIIRYHWDADEMSRIRFMYQAKVGRSLKSRLSQWTTGDYRNMLLACIGQLG